MHATRARTRARTLMVQLCFSMRVARPSRPGLGRDALVTPAIRASLDAE